MYAIVVGDGRVAEELAGRLIQAGNEVAIVAARHSDDLAVSLPSALVVRGEGGDARALADAGASAADIVVAACEDDAANISACVEAKRVFDVERVVALSHSPENAPAFDALGVDVVCSTSLVAATMLARVGVGREVTLA